MTQEQTERSIASGYMALSRMEKVSHFKSVIGLAVIQAFVLPFTVRYFLTNDTATLTKGILFISIGPALLAFALFLFQRQALKLRVRESRMSLEQLQARVEVVAPEHSWKVTLSSNQMLQLDTNTKDKPRVWGERITLIRTDENWLINSMRDPGIPRRNLTRMRGNQQNYKDLKALFGPEG